MYQMDNVFIKALEQDMGRKHVWNILLPGMSGTEHAIVDFTEENGTGLLFGMGQLARGSTVRGG